MARSSGRRPAGCWATMRTPRIASKRLPGGDQLARREPVRDWGSLLRHLATVRALDLLRVRCRTRSRTDALADPAAAVGREADPSQEAEANELAERLRAALAQLPPEQARFFA